MALKRLAINISLVFIECFLRHLTVARKKENNNKTIFSLNNKGLLKLFDLKMFNQVFVVQL